MVEAMLFRSVELPNSQRRLWPNAVAWSAGYVLPPNTDQWPARKTLNVFRPVKMGGRALDRRLISG
jgi:hypothetical protein